MSSTTASSVINRASKTTAFAVLGVVLAGIVIFVGNYNVPEGENGGTSEGISTAILCAVIAAVLFGLVVPRVRNVDRGALVLGVLTVLSAVVFWTGVTPILAASTLAIVRRQPTPSRRAVVMQWVAMGVAVLTVVWTLVNGHLF
jgi:hypothetical protein